MFDGAVGRAKFAHALPETDVLAKVPRQHRDQRGDALLARLEQVG